MTNRIFQQRSTLTLPQNSFTTPLLFEVGCERFQQFSFDLEEVLFELESSYEGPGTFQRFEWLKSEAIAIEPASSDANEFDFDVDVRWI